MLAVRDMLIGDNRCIYRITQEEIYTVSGDKQIVIHEAPQEKSSLSMGPP